MGVETVQNRAEFVDRIKCSYRRKVSYGDQKVFTVETRRCSVRMEIFRKVSWTFSYNECNNDGVFPFLYRTLKPHLQHARQNLVAELSGRKTQLLPAVPKHAKTLLQFKLVEGGLPSLNFIQWKLPI